MNKYTKIDGLIINELLLDRLDKAGNDLVIMSDGVHKLSPPEIVLSLYMAAVRLDSVIQLDNNNDEEPLWEGPLTIESTYDDGTTYRAVLSCMFEDITECKV